MNTARPLARITSTPLKTILTSSYTTTTTPTVTSPLAITSTLRRTSPPPLHLHHHRRALATTSSKMAPSAQDFIDLAKQRRSYYPLTKDLPITPARIEEIVKDLIDQIPSSFNSQSNRAVVLFGAEHDKLWDITAEILKPIVPAEQWEGTANKMAMFKAAAGTILFYVDQTVVNGMQEKFALYADRFPVWATESGGMLQYAAWTALEAEGLGANLQHYNPLIDVRVAEAWKVPADWKLAATLVFGGKGGEAGPKDYLPADQKFKSFGA